MKTPKKTIKNVSKKTLDVKNNMKTPDPKSTKHLIDDDDEDFNEPLDDIGAFDDIDAFDDGDEDEY